MSVRNNNYLGGLSMRIKGLHKNIYKLAQYSLSQEKLEQHRKKYEDPVKLWEKLKAEGVSDRVCSEIVKISRATYFRYKKRLDDLKKGILPPSKKPLKLNKPQWGEAEKQKVLMIRRTDPTYGKDKIATILRRDHGMNISNSTVGRILKTLMNTGTITKSRSAIRPRRPRNFQKGYATPWDFKLNKTMAMGERVQIDHMTVSKNGLHLKHFQAWDRKSKFIYAQIYSNAKSSSAKKFLLELINKAPFKILSIQVDGGSEFMADFEDTCKILKIPLFVLPPRRPQYNGGVERGNRTFREEFYANSNILADSMGALRCELAKAINKYNSYRPHHALKGNTPIQYIHNNINEVQKMSHIT